MMGAQSRIFISYSRRDLAAVKPIKDELEAQGFSCWMDLDGIESGEGNFKRVIIPAINGSIAFLFFLSNSSQQSEFAIKEIEFAKAKKKRIVLVRINDDSLEDYFLFDFQNSNIIDWRRLEQRTKLFNDLRTWLGWTGAPIVAGMNNVYDCQRSGASDEEMMNWAWAELKSMQAEVQSMRAEIQSMPGKGSIAIEKSKLALHSGEMIVCQACGKRNMIKDRIYCTACGSHLL